MSTERISRRAALKAGLAATALAYDLTLVTADERLIVWAKSGELFLVDTAGRSPKEFRVLAQNEQVLSDLAWPHVVLANGRLFCKDRVGNVACFR